MFKPKRILFREGLGILFSRCPGFFPNILKSLRCNFIKLCMHIDIAKMYIFNKNYWTGFCSFKVNALCNLTYIESACMRQ